jgi:hypothetical protein
METIGGPHDRSSTLPKLSPSFGTAVNGPGLWRSSTEAGRLVDPKLRILQRKEGQGRSTKGTSLNLSLTRRLTKG